MPVIGIDVLKTKLHCVLLSEDAKLKSRVLFNTAAGHVLRVSWVRRHLALRGRSVARGTGSPQVSSMRHSHCACSVPG